MFSFVPQKGAERDGGQQRTVPEHFSAHKTPKRQAWSRLGSRLTERQPQRSQSEPQMPLGAPWGPMAHSCASLTRAPETLEHCPTWEARGAGPRVRGTLRPCGRGLAGPAHRHARPSDWRWPAARGYALSQSRSPDDEVLFPRPSNRQAARHSVTGGQRQWGSGDSCPEALTRSVCFAASPPDQLRPLGSQQG